MSIPATPGVQSPEAKLVHSAAQSTAASPVKVMLIRRMSVKYDGVEDRVAMDISNVEGAVARLWFTRHGTDILVRTTASRVESYAVASMAKSGVTPANAGALRESALATHQLTARLTQRSVAAVELLPGTPEYLVTGLAMPPNPDHIQLDFKCRPDLNARVLLQSAELFQWLGALQRQYQKAGWGTEVWPQWFTQKSKK